MLKKNIFVIAAALLLCGCSSVFRFQYKAPAPLEKKDFVNAGKMSQMLGNKHESVLLLSLDELEFALQYSEYFVDAVKAAGFDVVAIPFADRSDADIESERGKELYDFVMLLHSKSLKTFYLLKESHYINRKKGSRFVWGKGNPYKDTLLNLKNFWKELPESAEMPTVIIAIEMNRWNDRNLERPAGLLFVWRNGRDFKGSSNDRMFMRSMQYFTECREYLDLEQLILVADEEVINAGEKNALTNGSIAELLKICDALAINFADRDAANVNDRLALLGMTRENGSIFAITSPGMQNIKTYTAWLEYLHKFHGSAVKFSGYAGVWIRNGKKLNRIWRNEK